MARQSRLDFPGALHHIMVRGMERKNLFKDDNDRRRFVRRLSEIMEETGTSCLAFSLMSNHVHLLVISGTTPLSTVMQKLLTSYAVYFNLRHNRSGKLYQNRFKSILCEKEDYLLELVRYIHLNPLRAGIIQTMKKLDTYRWTSHSIYMNKQKNDKFDTEEVFSNFDNTKIEARKRYRKFIASGVDMEDPIDYDGGGLIRSLGGYWEVLKKRKDNKRKREAADERILGSGTFVEKVLEQADEVESRQSELARKGFGVKEVEKRVCSLYNISPMDLKTRGQQNAVSYARALFSIWMFEDIGMPKSEIAVYLGTSRAAMTKLVKRGRVLREELGERGNLVN